MKKSKIKNQNIRFLFCILNFAFFITLANAQSTDQNFPTAVTTNQINGTIKARDIGDSRLTTYFYVFGGEQGDIFINVVTKNFDGDIDVFTLNGLRPLTKIKVFSDNSDNETGRIVYLRQPEKLILRIEGRSPNDDPATFQIKFAGSFIAEKSSSEDKDTPQVKTETQGEVRVNSVGTIIETKPKPTPKTAETKQETQTTTKTEVSKQETKTSEKENKVVNGEEKPKLEVVVTENLEKPKEEKTVEKAEVKPKEENKTEEVKVEKSAEITEEKSETKESKTDETKKEEENVKTEVSPLANIKLTVIFKDGRKIERPMSEILNVNVDKGMLTIIQKDGSIGRYSILEIVEFTIR